jgi:hypothetical protein
LLGTLDLMSPAGSSGEDRGIPAGVPEEFTAAYWSAYEEALQAQSVREDGAHAKRGVTGRSRRGRTVDDPPARNRPILIGTHRYEEPDVDPGAYERVRDSVWFVPALLLLLFLLLLLGAYVAGRRFSEHAAAQGHSARVLGTSPKLPVTPPAVGAPAVKPPSIPNGGVRPPTTPAAQLFALP